MVYYQHSYPFLWTFPLFPLWNAHFFFFFYIIQANCGAQISEHMFFVCIWDYTRYLQQPPFEVPRASDET